MRDSRNPRIFLKANHSFRMSVYFIISRLQVYVVRKHPSDESARILPKGTALTSHGSQIRALSSFGKALVCMDRLCNNSTFRHIANPIRQEQIRPSI